MPPPLKDCDAAIDYAAFLLPMVFARHNVNHENANCQWNAENLAEKTIKWSTLTPQISQLIREP